MALCSGLHVFTFVSTAVTLVVSTVFESPKEFKHGDVTHSPPTYKADAASPSTIQVGTVGADLSLPESVRSLSRDAPNLHPRQTAPAPATRLLRREILPGANIALFSRIGEDHSGLRRPRRRRFIVPELGDDFDDGDDDNDGDNDEDSDDDERSNPCEWSAWSEWTTCSNTCGVGKKTRMRMVGEFCREIEGQSKMEEVGNCFKAECPVPCRWGHWGPWAECSQTCGGNGRRSRGRVKYAAKHGGKPCSGDALDEESCNIVPCDPIRP